MPRIPSSILLVLIPFALKAQLIYEMAPLDLGPRSEDYAPVPIEGGILFTSIRETNGVISYRNADTGRPFSDLYWVPLVDDVPGTPVLFSAELSSPVNEGPADPTRNGSEICFTRNLQLPKNLSRIRNSQLGLFFAQREGEIWRPAVPFQHNSPAYAVMHPTYSADGNTLFFSSDMPGGLGGFDIYRCDRSANGWTSPVALGPELNGPANEVFPRMQADGTFYFSSDREGGAGKLDIYQSTYRNGHFTNAQALPQPVNSPYNDIGYTHLRDQYHAIMSSDRSGSDRIYHVARTIEKFTDCTEQRRNNYCYSFKGRKHAATANLPLEQVWEMGDGTRISGHHANHCYTAPGEYTVRSLLIDKKTGSTFYQLSSDQLLVQQIEQAFIAAPDTVRTGRQLALDPTLSHIPGSVPGEYHWDLGDGTFKHTPRVIHQFKKPGEYVVKLDILSNPDASGRITNKCNTKKIVVIDRYREQEDMTVVAVYQDAHGISHEFEFQELPFDELTFTVGENEDVVFSVQLFASKQRVDLDDPRFMEIKKHYRIIERYDPISANYTYSVGETKDIEELYAIFAKVKELQFLDSEVFAIEVEKLMDMSRIDLASLEELRNSKLRTHAILFEFNSAVLGEGSQEVLAEVLRLLQQHPQLNVVIEAHTDDVGSTKANLELSQQRAANVVAHLQGKGVNGDRMVAVGHGENQPIASNRTEAGRSRNRRVEFRMLVKEDASIVQMKK